MVAVKCSCDYQLILNYDVHLTNISVVAYIAHQLQITILHLIQYIHHSHETNEETDFDFFCCISE